MPRTRRPRITIRRISRDGREAASGWEWRVKLLAGMGFASDDRAV
jgi:hypothetical protein